MAHAVCSEFNSTETCMATPESKRTWTRAMKCPRTIKQMVDDISFREILAPTGIRHDLKKFKDGFGCR